MSGRNQFAGFERVRPRLALRWRRRLLVLLLRWRQRLLVLLLWRWQRRRLHLLCGSRYGPAHQRGKRHRGKA
jgi:hypothetical protein